MTAASILQLSQRRLSPALFALIVLAFLLPFGTVACDGAETTFTGVQLATWRVPAGGQVERGELDCSADLAECIEDSGSFAAAVALLAAIVGLGVGTAGLRRGEGWCAAAGLVAMLYLSVDAAMELADITFHAAYLLGLLVYVWLALLHVWRAVMRRRERHAAQISSR